MSLTAVIEPFPGQTDPRALRLALRITNPTNNRITILNPDLGIPSPAVRWTHGVEAYRTALLLSFHFLSMSVTDEASGQQLPPRPEVMTAATPALRPPIELGPGDALEVPIPVGIFYELAAGTAYDVALTYGDQKLKVSARARVVAPR